MTSKEHKEYIAQLKQYSVKLLKTETEVKGFLIEAGIHTELGNLKRVYSSSESQIGYKQNGSKDELKAK